MESGVFDLDMEGASNDLDTGSDGAVDLTLEDGAEAEATAHAPRAECARWALEQVEDLQIACYGPGSFYR